MTTTSRTAATEPHHPQAEHPHPDQPETPVMELLEEHVPLSLIMDLSRPAGPDSADILQTEGAPQSAWWVQP